MLLMSIIPKPSLPRPPAPDPWKKLSSLKLVPGAKMLRTADLEEAGSHQTRDLQVPWSWTSSLQNCEK